jgi:hypothetical protein
MHGGPVLLTGTCWTYLQTFAAAKMFSEKKEIRLIVMKKYRLIYFQLTFQGLEAAVKGCRH